MLLEIEKVILTRDIRKERNLPVEDANTDVIVKMKNGDIYLASFFSYEDIERLRKKHLKTKEFLGGDFFWVKGMILIKDYEKSTIRNVVKHLQFEGNFKEVFLKI